MSFEHGSMVWVTALVAVTITLIFALDFAYRRRLIERIGDATMISLMANSVAVKRRTIRAILFTLALTLCTVALIRPTVPGKGGWRQRGIDVVFVYDFSKSMLARDVYPNRLERSLKEAESLHTGLAADRMASVVFAGGTAYFPLTHDHQAARLLYQGLRPSDMAPGSDLGQALMVANCLLRVDEAGVACDELLAPGTGGDPIQSSASEGPLVEPPLVSDRARAVVLFTDGDDTEGHALEAAQYAKSLGIELFVVGVGTPGGELIPKESARGAAWQEAEDGSFVTTKLNEQVLRELSDTTGGASSYYSLGQGRWQGEALLGQLKLLKRGDLELRVLNRRKHIFRRFLFPAFLLLIIEACVFERRRKAGVPRVNV